MEKEKPEEGENQYVLYYFELHGYGDPIRALLTHAGIKFEDKMIPLKEWAKHKEN